MGIFISAGQFHYAFCYPSDLFCQVFVKVNQDIKRLSEILRWTRQVHKPLNIGTAPSVLTGKGRGYTVEEKLAFYLPGDATPMVHELSSGP
jgi:hypothetical protein